MTAQIRKGWIAVDFDGTLVARSSQAEGIGEPIMPMLERVWQWLEEGRDVRLFTARAYPPPGSEHKLKPLRAWMREWLGKELPITCTKDPEMCALFDDVAVSVGQDTGELAIASGNETEELVKDASEVQ